MRIAVVGSGVVGASVSWHLSRAGAEVLAFDARAPGMGVSNCSFSWVNASSKVQTREHFELSVAGMNAYSQLARVLSSNSWWHPTGHLRWYDTQIDEEELCESVQKLRSWGYQASCWSAERVHRLLEPEVKFPTDDSQIAVFFDEGWVDGQGLAQRFIADAIQSGAQARFGSAIANVVLDDGVVSEVVTEDSQRYNVDAVVNASGPSAGGMAACVGRKLPMLDEPGFVVRLACSKPPIRRAMHTPHVEIRPDGPDRIVLHSREIDALISPGTQVENLSRQLIDLAVDVVPALGAATLIGGMIAQRPIPVDRLPSVGGIESIPGYYEAVMHGGITLGGVVGRVLTSEIIHGEIDPLVAPFRPGRFEE